MAEKKTLEYCMNACKIIVYVIKSLWLWNKAIKVHQRKGSLEVLNGIETLQSKAALKA